MYEAFAFIDGAGYNITGMLEVRTDGTCTVECMRPCSTQVFVRETTLAHICIRKP